MHSFSLKQIPLKARGYVCHALGLLAVVLMAGALCAPAFAQTDMQNRLKRLENELQTLSRAVYKGETPPAGVAGGFGGGSNTADLEIRLQQIETEMRDLRGDMERQNFEVRQLKAELERVSSDIELRLNDLERGGSSNGGAVPNTAGGGPIKTLNTAPTNGNAVPAQNSGGYEWSSNNADSGQLGSFKITPNGNAASGADLAAATYENAFALIKNRQYERAQADFEVFLRDFPDHPLAGNAQYWLGETHYVRGDYDTAARVFAEGYQKYPKGSKLADNLLKLGLSLDAAGKTQDACVALRQLKKENPAGAAPVLRRADQEISRMGC